jgi:carbonic anhydrase
MLGYQRFMERYWFENRDVFQALAAKGQAPRAMVIACCDSRVSPEVIFDTEPGEIFVVRNVANLVPPYAPDSDNHGTSAALEFAVRKLLVSHIIVMGHSLCGGIRALVEDNLTDDDDFIGPWMKIATVARERSLAVADGVVETARQLCEHESIRVSLANLMTFPWIRSRVEQGDLQLHGWFFNIESGSLDRI